MFYLLGLFLFVGANNTYPLGCEIEARAPAIFCLSS